jgi:ERCC4-type nuclease
VNKQKPILLIDTREKRPWQFDDDESFEGVQYTKLDAGDYTIAGLEKIITIERKASVDELFINFTKNKKRIFAEFERLKDHPFKIIIIEESCDDVMNPNTYYVNRKHINKASPKMPAAVVVSNLMSLMLEHGAHVIFAGTKGRSMAKGILLKAYELYQKRLL